MEQIARVPCVLVVDDDLANLRVFERVFRRDFEVVTAPSGAAAVAALDRFDPDVAFVDFRMPGMDGAAVLAALHRLHPTTTCFLLTGYGDLAETQALVEGGLCVGVLTKPWDRAAIRSAVHGVVGVSERQASAG